MAKGNKESIQGFIANAGEQLRKAANKFPYRIRVFTRETPVSPQNVELTSSEKTREVPVYPDTPHGRLLTALHTNTPEVSRETDRYWRGVAIDYIYWLKHTPNSPYDDAVYTHVEKLFTKTGVRELIAIFSSEDNTYALELYTAIKTFIADIERNCTVILLQEKPSNLGELERKNIENVIFTFNGQMMLLS